MAGAYSNHDLAGKLKNWLIVDRTRKIPRFIDKPSEI